MNSLLITGYKAFELGILTAKDPRLPIIKAVSYTHLTLPTKA